MVRQKDRWIDVMYWPVIVEVDVAQAGEEGGVVDSCDPVVAGVEGLQAELVRQLVIVPNLVDPR